MLYCRFSNLGERSPPAALRRYERGGGERGHRSPPSPRGGGGVAPPGPAPFRCAPARLCHWLRGR